MDDIFDVFVVPSGIEYYYIGMIEIFYDTKRRFRYYALAQSLYPIGGFDTTDTLPIDIPVLVNSIRCKPSLLLQSIRRGNTVRYPYKVYKILLVLHKNYASVIDRSIRYTFHPDSNNVHIKLSDRLLREIRGHNHRSFRTLYRGMILFDTKYQ